MLNVKIMILLFLLGIYCFTLFKKGNCELTDEVLNSQTPRCTWNMLKKATGYLIDLDGTLTVGSSLVKGKEGNGNAAQRYFDFLEKNNMNYVFLSNGFKSNECVRDKFSYPPFKLLPENLSHSWEKSHVWTAATAVREFLRDELAYKKAKIYVISTTIRCKTFYDSCFRVINKTIPAEEKVNWELRMDLDWNEVYQWAHEASSNITPVYVVLCIESMPSDIIGGRVDAVAEEKFNESFIIKKEDLYDLIDPVRGLSRSAYLTMDHDLLSKIFLLVNNGAQLVEGAGDILQVNPRNPNYPHIDTNSPSIGSYSELISLSVGNNNSKIKKRTGKGGIDGTEYMMNKGMYMLVQQGKEGGRHVDPQKTQEIFVVGDNLLTDVRAANLSGMSSILVLSGLHSRNDAALLQIFPTCYVQDVGEIVDICERMK